MTPLTSFIISVAAVVVATVAAFISRHYAKRAERLNQSTREHLTDIRTAKPAKDA